MQVRQIIAGVSIALLPSIAIADYGSAWVGSVTSIYDGDTFKGDIAGWPAIVGKDILIRINGIDAPELRAYCENEKEQAKRAKRYLIDMLRGARAIELRHIERGKYFMIVADVYADGINVGERLIKEGLAVPYNGGFKRNPWCSPSAE